VDRGRGQRVIAGAELGDVLIAAAADGSVAVRVEATDFGAERPFGARLVVADGRVPRDAETETRRWLQLARWTPRLAIAFESARGDAQGDSIAELWRESEELNREVEEPLARIGGPRTVLVADLDRMTEQVGSWPAEVGPILRLADGVRPLLGIVAKAPFPPNVTVRILARLVSGGVLLVGSREPEERETVVSPEPIED